MGRGNLFRTLALTLVVLAPGGLFGQSESGTPIEVRNVRYGYVRPMGGSDNWLEVTVELNVRGTPVGNPQFVDSVRVALSLSLRNPLEGDSDFVFFRSDAEASTLESGAARFRFYLPPAVVRRYQISGEPFAFAVDVWIDGRPIAQTAAAVSSVLANADALRSFRDRVAQDGVRNDGILLPQFKTPFLIEYARDTPAFVWRGR
ncbi:MAG: hypothetical protein R3F07_17605 [Opitutaceae bacterium]